MGENFNVPVSKIICLGGPNNGGMITTPRPIHPTKMRFFVVGEFPELPDSIGFLPMGVDHKGTKAVYELIGYFISQEQDDALFGVPVHIGIPVRPDVLTRNPGLDEHDLDNKGGIGNGK